MALVCRTEELNLATGSGNRENQFACGSPPLRDRCVIGVRSTSTRTASPVRIRGRHPAFTA